MSSINNHGHSDLDPRDYDSLLDLKDAILEQIGKERAKAEVGVICGSGLGHLADHLENPFYLPFEKIPGFPVPSVEGHKGNLVFGTLHGQKIICLQGRFHPYEHGMDLALSNSATTKKIECSTPVRMMHLLGIHTLIVSNAAGGINPQFQFGDLMIIKDHIFLPGLAGFSPMVGQNDPRFGARFVSVHDCYDLTLRNIAKQVAEEQKTRVSEGIYVMSGGPQYESPAEVLVFKTVGADALGMSTCHEVIVARQCGIRVFGFSLITNIANLDADSSVVVSHAEVLQTAKEAGTRATAFVDEILRRLPHLPTPSVHAPVLERKRPRKFSMQQPY